MFSTSTLIAVQMFYVKHWPAIAAIAFFLFYGFVDGMFRQTLLHFRLTNAYRSVLGCIVEEDPIRTFIVSTPNSRQLTRAT